MLLLRDNDPLRLGAATAFFTLFALPPILIILTTLFGIIFRGAIEDGSLFLHLSQLIGPNSAAEIQSILLNLRSLGKNLLITAAGFVFLLFVSTTLFIVVQNSIHQVWRIRHRPGHRYRRALLDRVVSVGLILFSGLLFIFGLLADFGIAFLQRLLQRFDHEINVAGFQLISALVTLVLFALWFAILFRYLPYVRVAWRVIWAGSFLTSLLFSVGTYLMGVFLINSNLNTIYGAAGSLVVLLLFVFYSSLILYFGAAFIWVYATQREKSWLLKGYASRYVLADDE